MAAHLSLLLGKPPKPGSLLAEVAENLAAHGDRVEVLLPHEQSVDPEVLSDRDLVVHRGLHTTLTPLLGAIHERGIPLCTPFAADEALRDRRAWRGHLLAAGLPLPPAEEQDDWRAVLESGRDREVVVKALSGPGRGSQVLAGTLGTLPAEAPFPGPYLIEPRLLAEDIDHKLYLAGDAVRGLLKPSTLTHAHVTTGEPFAPDAELVELALEVGRVLDAHLCGVDVLRTPEGPVIIDVNAFPGFRGVAEAPDLVAAHLREHAPRG